MAREETLEPVSTGLSLWLARNAYRFLMRFAPDLFLHFTDKAENHFVHDGTRLIEQIVSDKSGRYTCARFFYKYEFDNGATKNMPFHLVLADKLHYPIPVQHLNATADIESAPKVTALLKLQGKTLYNGDVYRLKNLHLSTDGGLCLDVAVDKYFHGLETSDRHYYNLALMRWICPAGVPWCDWLVIERWTRQLSAIAAEDFSGYCAMVGVSVFVYMQSGTGEVSFLRKRISRKKATGSSLLHVVPSFMLTPLKVNGSSQIDEAYILASIVKEYLEELQNQSEFALDNFNVEMLLERAKYFYRRSGKKDSFLRAIIEEKAVQFHGVAVDAFRLRPELIFSVRLDQKVSASISWEVDKAEWITVRDKADLDRIIEQESARYVPPGLAALITVARHLFSGKSAELKA